MKISKNYIIIYFIILVAIASRFVPHMVNLSAITAIGIFSAVYLTKKEAIGITLIARLVSDLFLGFFSWPLMVAVYISHLAGIVFGLWIKKSNELNGGQTFTRWAKIIFSGFGSAFVFYIVTNFVAFYPEFYPQNISGLIASYANGLPFLRGTLVGDVGYTIALFGTFALVKSLANIRAKKVTMNPNFSLK